MRAKCGLWVWGVAWLSLVCVALTGCGGSSASGDAGNTDTGGAVSLEQLAASIADDPFASGSFAAQLNRPGSAELRNALAAHEEQIARAMTLADQGFELDKLDHADPANIRSKRMDSVRKCINLLAADAANIQRDAASSRDIDAFREKMSEDGQAYLERLEAALALAIEAKRQAQTGDEGVYALVLVEQILGVFPDTTTLNAMGEDLRDRTRALIEGIDEETLLETRSLNDADLERFAAMMRAGVSEDVAAGAPDAFAGAQLDLIAGLDDAERQRRAELITTSGSQLLDLITGSSTQSPNVVLMIQQLRDSLEDEGGPMLGVFPEINLIATRVKAKLDRVKGVVRGD